MCREIFASSRRSVTIVNLKKIKLTVIFFKKINLLVDVCLWILESIKIINLQTNSLVTKETKHKNISTLMDINFHNEIASTEN